jgi:hypothetical protein
MLENELGVGKTEPPTVTVQLEPPLLGVPETEPPSSLIN